MRGVGADDGRTGAEAGAYLQAFAKDRPTLLVGARIMKYVATAKPTDDHYLLLARLLQRGGDDTGALAAAQRAVQAGRTAGLPVEDAEALLVELGKE